jgi:hypothetical protein
MVTSREVSEARERRKRQLRAESDGYRVELTVHCEAVVEVCRDWRQVAGSVGRAAFRCASWVGPVVGTAVAGRLLQSGPALAWAGRLLSGRRP